eukprot:CAMPEP_0201252678 /NCGR_PEP_ID=MMETSP0852-20130820/67046_1 /ASSEMBLY_ACC=CAM_ASM_000632 /TAXON_ID=183588 /ORGANISM="Pseudo-nitzschia fraudulenta, Strain WWA7" /LENGTH=162 /DNA_ID=CAMNT_0047552413 /DNA_START=730 /DNA_END=1215 /DNA_ORIENTATION=-
MNDYVSVKDKADPSVVHKVLKLLLQITIRELHNDLINQLPDASKDGIPLISDTKLREMMPPQVKKMTDAFLDEDERKERPKDALNLLQCQPVDNAFPDLVHYSCAKGICEHCPKMRPHPVLMRSNTKILFHAYGVVTTCTEHGVLFREWNGHCQHCDSKRDG